MEIIFKVRENFGILLLFVGWSHLYNYAVAVFDDDDDDDNNGLSVVIICSHSKYK
jgi:hypothetical protein